MGKIMNLGVAVQSESEKFLKAKKGKNKVLERLKWGKNVKMLLKIIIM